VKKNTAKIIATCSAGVVALAGICVVAFATTNNKELKEEIQTQVIVDTIFPPRGDIVVTGEYVGTVEPSEQVIIYPKVSGEVLAVNFNIGDIVEAGDVLFEIDSKALQLSISQSQAVVASAQAKAQYNLVIAEKNLETQEFNVENGYDSGLISAESVVKNAESAVKKAENGLEAANATLASARRSLREFRDEEDYYDDDDTYDTLYRQYRDAVVQAEIAVEGTQISLENANETLTQAQESLRSTKMLAEEKTVTTQENIEIAKLNTNFNDQYIAIQKLQNDLNNYTIKTPISGVVESRNIDPYDTASTQSPAFVIANKNAMTVSFQVSETTWGIMKPGDTITVEKDSVKWTGTISEISSTANNGGGLYTVKAMVENAPFPMNTGSAIKVLAKMQETKNTIMLPINTVYYDNGLPYVYIYENNISKKIYVETGIADTESIAVISGITAADQVITTWNATLRDGAEVVLESEYQDMELFVGELYTGQTGLPETDESSVAIQIPIEVGHNENNTQSDDETISAEDAE